MGCGWPELRQTGFSNPELECPICYIQLWRRDDGSLGREKPEPKEGGAWPDNKSGNILGNSGGNKKVTSQKP
jgi:hypothetical protein